MPTHWRGNHYRVVIDMARNQARNRGRYQATPETYQTRSKVRPETLARFARVHGLTSISNDGDERFVNGQSIAVRMDLSTLENRIEALMQADFTRSMQAMVDRQIMAMTPRRASSSLYDRLRAVHGSISGRVANAQVAPLQLREVQNYSSQALAADLVLAQNFNRFSAALRQVGLSASDASDALRYLAQSMRGSPSNPTGFFGEFDQLSEPENEDPPEQKAEPAPSHPDAGKLVVRRRTSRTLVGEVVVDYREPSGGIARVGKSLEPIIKHTSKRKLR